MTNEALEAYQLHVALDVQGLSFYRHFTRQGLSSLDLLNLITDYNFDYTHTVQCISSQHRFRSVAVITSALHAEGPGFEPQRNHFIIFSSIELLQNNCGTMY